MVQRERRPREWADSLDPRAHFLHGLALLDRGNAAGAAVSLRRAVYLDPDFTCAAFALARAYAAIGDTTSAGRVHQQALAVVDSEQEPRLFERREADALRTACGARLKLVGDEGRGA